MCKRLSLHKTEGIKAYRLQLEKIIKYSLTRVNPKDSLSAEKLLTTFSRGWSQVFYILFRREYLKLAKDRENRKFLWLMELIIWKVHIWTDAIGNLEMKPNKCTQDVFWRNLATWKKSTRRNMRWIKLIFKFILLPFESDKSMILSSVQQKKKIDILSVDSI